MQSLLQNEKYFPKRAETKAASNATSNDGASLPEVVKQVAVSLLGEKNLRQGSSAGVQTKGGDLAVFNILTELLPSLDSRGTFFWNNLGKSFASMLETAAFSIEAQARFLIFTYARVLPFMGPEDQTKGPGVILTVEGSPIEISWVIPNRSKPRPGEITRQLRYGTEPRHPETGDLLRGNLVLDYLTSEEGGLGVVSCPEGAMDWRRKTENFLFPGEDGEEIPEGSRFFMAFDFHASGILTIKAYYVCAFRPPSGQMTVTDEGRPLHQLVAQLHPSLPEPYETIRKYFGDVPPERRPYAGMISMDCIPSDMNRLKIYFHKNEGTSWEVAKAGFTLDGALDRPDVNDALEKLEILWNYMFPDGSSDKSNELVAPSSGEEEDESRLKQPATGIMFYYELIAGDNVVYPKIYLPVRTYCPNDAHICDAVEKFYDAVGVEGPEVGEHGKGWVSREVAKTYTHRPLEQRTGVHTYVTFGARKAGWELTSYLSPEPWNKN